MKRSCAAGHTWVGDAPSCPECSSAGVESRSWASGSTEKQVPVDELPPPPRALPQARATTETADQPSGFPVIAGYRLLTELGQGGMGVVYRAVQAALNREVALKVIRGGAGIAPDDLLRFQIEAEAVAHLQHPNIVQVFEVGERDGLPYLALEYVPGGTLARRISEMPLGPREGAAVAIALSRGMQHAHERGVLHRDLKPANILLAGDTPKISDFGLAKRLDLEPGPTQTQAGQVMGTPSFMSPEQASGAGTLAGPATDIYALGAILYDCLTGRPPFQAPTSRETLLQVILDDPVAPTRLQPGIPRDLETICLKCLAKEPRRRYASAADLADDLQRYLDGRPVIARRTPWWERGWKLAKRRKAATAAVAAVVVGGVAIGVQAFRHTRDIEKQNEKLRLANVTITEERDRAEGNLGYAVEAVDKMLTDVAIFHISHVPHLDATRVVLIEGAVRLYDKLSALQTDDPRLKLKTAETLSKTAALYSDLGKQAAAMDRCERALVIVRELSESGAGSIPEDTLLRFEALFRNLRGRIRLRDGGNPTQAREDQEAALAIRESLLAAHPPVVIAADSSQVDRRYEVLLNYIDLSVTCRAEGVNEKRALYLNRGREVADELLTDYPKHSMYGFAAAVAFSELGVMALENRDFADAVEPLEKSLRLWRERTADGRADIGTWAELSRCLSNLGSTWRRQGFLKKATPYADEARAIRERLAADHPEIREFGLGLGRSYFEAGEISRAKGETATALEWLSKSINQYEKIMPKVPTAFPDRAYLLDSYEVRRATHAQLGNAAEVQSDSKRVKELERK